MSPLLSLCWKATRRTRFKTLLHHKTWQIYLAALGLISTENLFSVFCGFHCKFMHIVRLSFLLASVRIVIVATACQTRLLCLIWHTARRVLWVGFFFTCAVCSCHHWLTHVHCLSLSRQWTCLVNNGAWVDYEKSLPASLVLALWGCGNKL